MRVRHMYSEGIDNIDCVGGNDIEEDNNYYWGLIIYLVKVYWNVDNNIDIQYVFILSIIIINGG